MTTRHPRLISFFFALLLIGAIASAPPSVAGPRPQAQSAAFQPTACAPLVKLPLGFAPGPDFVCGYLTVPEQHSRPDGPTIALGVVILKSNGPSPRPDPLVMAQGGPGGSTIET